MAVGIAGCGDDTTPDMDAAVSLDASADAELDAGPATFESCSENVIIPTDTGYEFDEFYQLMDFTNEELDLRLRVALSPAPLDRIIGLAINYKTRTFALEDADGVSCVRDEAQLTYEVTQHNDNDTLTAMLGPDELYVVLMVYDRFAETFTDTLTIEHPQSGAPTEGPYSLTQAGCSVHREEGVSECTYQIREPY